MTCDPRIPIRFGTVSEAGPDTALLIEGDAPVPAGLAHGRFVVRPVFGHAAGCACCAPRGPVAGALARLFLERARGETELFLGVVAVTTSEAGRRAVRTALNADAVSAARFRLETV